MIHPESLFSHLNTVALISWLVLLFAPNSRLCRGLIRSYAIPTALSAIYALIILFKFSQIDGGFNTLAQAQALLAHPWGGVAGWIHYLAFDLFVGIWIVDRAERQGTPQYLVAPFLALTFLFGPMGLLGWILFEPIAPQVPTALPRLLRDDSAFALGGLLLLLCGALALTAAGFDSRRLDGSLVWIKPAKFFLSLGIYVLTLAWFFGKMREYLSARYVRFLHRWTFLVVFVEMVIICFQAYRGVRSHYNMESIFDQTLYGIMGVAIVANLGVIAHFSRKWWAARPHLSPGVWMGGAYGLALFLVAGVLGMVMSAQPWSRVGAEDSATSVLLLGWNQMGGDLRISHFLGLHGFQALPIVGWVADRRRWRMAKVHLIGLAWVGLTIGLFLLAWNGIPLLAP